MAIGDLSIFHKELPEVFEKFLYPPDWDDEWVFIDVFSPEMSIPNEIDISPLSETLAESIISLDEYYRLPYFPSDFPGGPIPWQKDFLPPPDALAFYLPFHYFYPIWWGIYLSYEGVSWLSNYILEKSERTINQRESVLCSQIFLYAHEAYHHMVESFATRLEVTHRVPLYRKGFQQIYRESMENPDQCAEPYPADEEALANAYAYLKTLNKFKQQKAKKHSLAKALKSYFKGSPPCYKRALEYLTLNKFKKAECEFAELNHLTFKNDPKDDDIWLCFPHAFSGIARITSRIKYIIHSDSPLSKRVKLSLRFLRYRELKKKLEKLAKCMIVGQKGGHEIWKPPTGKPFPVPRHPGELKTGTLAKIIKQAGLNMSVMQFIQVKV